MLNPQAISNSTGSIPDLDLDNLALLNVYGDSVALSSDRDISSTPQPAFLRGQTPDASGQIHDATPCCVILVGDDDARDLDVFYFYFYSYDAGPNVTQVAEPLRALVEKLLEAAPAMHFGNHVGDWENNMIRFRDGEPQGIYYSQHRGGAAYDWDDATVSKMEGRVSSPVHPRPLPAPLHG
jgi:hypothetical protein